MNTLSAMDYGVMLTSKTGKRTMFDETWHNRDECLGYLRSIQEWSEEHGIGVSLCCVMQAEATEIPNDAK